MRGPAPGRRRSVAARTVALVALAFALLAVAGHVDFADSDQPILARATVTVVAGASTIPIPAGYLGLSTEYWSLPVFARHETVFERVLALLRVPGGPLVLRVGGDSADHTFWAPRAHRLPHWAFAITPSWAAQVRRLTRRLDLRLILDLNLITGSSATAGRWARAAVAHLPARQLIGFEVGNEPDIYNHAFWTAMTGGSAYRGRPLPAALSAARYIADFRADAAAVRQAAPGVPLLGPALSSPGRHRDWITALLAAHPAGLGAVTVHRYPFSACAHHRRSPAYATVGRLLSPTAGRRLNAGIAPALASARRAGLPLRLTELNSVTCGGRRGVSNTFATGLWAPGALFSLLRPGIAGVNLHVRANTINAPFAFGADGLIARPLLYGMLMFLRTLGPQAKLVRLHLAAGPSLRLSAWAVSSGGRLRVLVINKGRRTVRLRLRLPVSGAMTVQRLLGRSPRAEGGVTLDGQHLTATGGWAGRIQTETVDAHQGYRILVPRFSAALLDARLLPPADEALRAPRPNNKPL